MAESEQQPAPALPIPVIVGERVAKLSPQAMNNLILGIAVVGIGLLIYIDRRDRFERDAMQLRHYESQNEMMRQTISSSTQAVQTLSIQVGKLDRTMSDFVRKAAPKEEPEEEEDEDELALGAGAIGKVNAEIHLAPAPHSVPVRAATGADNLNGAGVVGGRIGDEENQSRCEPVRNVPVDRAVSDAVLARWQEDTDGPIRVRGLCDLRCVPVGSDES